MNVVQSGGIGQITSVFTRGTNSNQTLMLKDGVRLNTGSQHTASLPFIDLTNVSRIEVLKGPASVQYGSDAVAAWYNSLATHPLNKTSLPRLKLVTKALTKQLLVLI